MFDLKKSLACCRAADRPNRSATGNVLFGRNLDYPSLGYAHEYSLVTVYRPTGKHAFASIGFPGLVGCLSGMNDAGLSLGVLEIYAVKRGGREVRRQRHALRPVLSADAGGMHDHRRGREAAALDATHDVDLPGHQRQGQGCAVFEITPEELIGPQAGGRHLRLHESLSARRNEAGRSTRSCPAALSAWTSWKSAAMEKMGIADIHKSLHAVPTRTRPCKP